MGPYKLRRMPSLKVRFGKAVARLRKRTAVSQERFADAIGVHRTTIGTIERGRGTPSLDIIGRIALGLGISLTRLFEAVESENG